MIFVFIEMQGCDLKKTEILKLSKSQIKERDLLIKLASIGYNLKQEPKNIVTNQQLDYEIRSFIDCFNFKGHYNVAKKHFVEYFKNRFGIKIDEQIEKNSQYSNFSFNPDLLLHNSSENSVSNIKFLRRLKSEEELSYILSNSLSDEL